VTVHHYRFAAGAERRRTFRLSWDCHGVISDHVRPVLPRRSDSATLVASSLVYRIKFKLALVIFTVHIGLCRCRDHRTNSI